MLSHFSVPLLIIVHVISPFLTFVHLGLFILFLLLASSSTIFPLLHLIFSNLLSNLLSIPSSTIPNRNLFAFPMNDNRALFFLLSAPPSYHYYIQYNLLLIRLRFAIISSVPTGFAYHSHIPMLFLYISLVLLLLFILNTCLPEVLVHLLSAKTILIPVNPSLNT
jgi:hypothetical protein